jgi:hypothetical protein
MLISGKFVLASLGFGIGSLMCTGLLQVPSISHPSPAQGSSSSVGNAFQTVLGQADSLYREASTDAAPKFRSLADRSSAFVSSNANTARLQFKGIESSVASHMSIDAWVPDNAPYWVRGNVQVAAQAMGTQAISVADKVPAVRSIKTNLERLAGVR